MSLCNDVDVALCKAIKLYRLDPMHKGEKVKMMFSEGFNKFLDSAYGESFRQLSLVWDEFSIIRFKIVKGSGKHNGLNMGDVHHMKHLAEKW